MSDEELEDIIDRWFNDPEVEGAVTKRTLLVLARRVAEAQRRWELNDLDRD